MPDPVSSTERPPAPTDGLERLLTVARTDSAILNSEPNVTEAGLNSKRNVIETGLNSKPNVTETRLNSKSNVKDINCSCNKYNTDIT